MSRKLTSDLFMHELSGTGATFGRKSDINVVFQGNTAMTDGNVVVLPSLASGKDLDPATQAVVRGFLDHEAGHLRHSDMTVLNDEYERWEKNGQKLIKATHNALEDIWLERRVLKEYPGASENLKATATHVNTKLKKQIEDGEVERKDLEDAEVVGPLGITWRGRKDYGGALSSELFDMLPKDVQDKIDKAISGLDTCENSRDIVKLAEDVAAMFGDVTAKPQPPQPKPSRGEGKRGDGDGGGKDGDADGDERGKGGRSDRENLESTSTEKTEGERHDGEGSTGAGGICDGMKAPKEKRDPLEGFDPKDVVMDALREAGAMGGGRDFRAMGLHDDLFVDVMSKEGALKGLSTKSPGSRMFPGGRSWGQQVADRYDNRDYDRIVDSMRSEVGVVRRRLERALIAKQQRVWTGGHEQGRLDTRRFPGVLTGRTNVFKQRSDASDLDTAVTILIDMSGSMGGCREEMAAKCAIALAEALEKTTVSYEVLSFRNVRKISMRPKPKSKEARRRMYDMHNRYEALDIDEYKRFSDRLFTRRPAMASIAGQHGGNNSDACALRMVWNRLRKRGESRKVVLVLSDGQPAAAGRGHRQQLTSAVREIMAEGCFVAGIGIRSKAVEEYYPVFCVVEDLDDLAGAGLSIISKALLGEFIAGASGKAVIKEAS